MADGTPRPDELLRARSGAEVLLGLALFFLFCSILPLIAFTDVDPLRVVGGVLILLSAVTLTAAAVARAGLGRFRQANEEALSAIARGELDRAARIYRTWTERGASVVRSLARHNLAVVWARRGDLDGAIALLVDNESGVLRGGLLGPSAAQIALCLGLAGEQELAAEWRAEADRRLSDTGPGRAVGALARAVVDCRNGKADRAARDLEHVWPDAEGHLRASDVRPLAVVRAFAVAQAGGPRQVGVAEGLLGDARPRFSGEFDWLGARWPEMRVFLVASGLAAAGAGRSEEGPAAADRSVRSGG